MNKKLITLSLNEEIIERAKRYAKSNKTSLSRMIEAYFESLTSKQGETELKTTPLVESLCGVINLPAEFDLKESRAKYLLEKNKLIFNQV